MQRYRWVLPASPFCTSQSWIIKGLNRWTNTIQKCILISNFNRLTNGSICIILQTFILRNSQFYRTETSFFQKGHFTCILATFERNANWETKTQTIQHLLIILQDYLYLTWMLHFYSIFFEIYLLHLACFCDFCEAHI